MSNIQTFRGGLPSFSTVATFTLLFFSKVLAKELVVVLSCSKNAAGSTSCNIGINPVLTLGLMLNGGYQWLS